MDVSICVLSILEDLSFFSLFGASSITYIEFVLKIIQTKKKSPSQGVSCFVPLKKIISDIFHVFLRMIIIRKLDV